MNIGSLDSSGTPVIKISIKGAYQKSEREFTAVVDTGFTGFISMPMVKAFPLGLILFGTTSMVLADGTTQARFTALGRASLDGTTWKDGLVVLEYEDVDILVGMDFIRTFDKILLVAPLVGTVSLMDMADLKPQPVAPMTAKTLEETSGGAREGGPEAAPAEPGGVITGANEGVHAADHLGAEDRRREAKEDAAEAPLADRNP